MAVRGVSNNPASPLYNASAPNLTGQTGQLCTVLDAVLVNGFSGFTSLGWTIAYTGTSKRQYAMAAGGTSCQLYVDDSGPGAGTFREARVNGFKTGSALGTGTGQFPTTAQMTAPSGALVIRKSTTADGTVRYWTIVGDGHTFYMFVETGDNTAPVTAYSIMFGDFFSYSSTDTSNCMIIGRILENTAAGGAGGAVSLTLLYDGFAWLNVPDYTSTSRTLPGHYVAASFTNTGGSLNVGKISDQAKMGTASVSGTITNGALGWNGSPGNFLASNGYSLWSNQFNYPNGVDSGLYLAPIWIVHNGMVRGYMKGLWCPLQHLPLTHNDTYAGTGNLSGKSLISQNVFISHHSGNAATADVAQAHIEYSDTWN